MSEVNPNPCIYFIPQDYKNIVGENLNDVATLTGYPSISNKTDVFNVWLAQNSQSISLSMQQEQFNYTINQDKNLLNGVSQGINNVTSLNVGGALTTGFETGMNIAQTQGNHEFFIKNQLAQIEKQSLLPDNVTLSSSNATLIGYELIKQDIFEQYSIKYEYAERIDKYFDMYGYLMNKIDVPKLHNRSNWNYIKTIGCNITANIPQNDLQLIKNMFDNGITIWHNPKTFLDYSQENN